MLFYTLTLYFVILFRYILFVILRQIPDLNFFFVTLQLYPKCVFKDIQMLVGRSMSLDHS